jgi:hypothetical protein
MDFYHLCDQIPVVNNLKGENLFSSWFQRFSTSWKGGSGGAVHIMVDRKQNRRERGQKQNPERHISNNLLSPTKHHLP